MTTTEATTATATDWEPPTCPSWCWGDHKPDDTPEEQVHRGGELRSAATAPVYEDGDVIGGVEVTLRQPVGSEVASVNIASTDSYPWVAMSPAEARALAANLIRACNDAEGVDSGILSPQSMASLRATMATLTAVRDDMISVFTTAS